MSGIYTQKPEKQKFMVEAEIDEALSAMVRDVSLRTDPSYSRADTLHDDLISFVEKHRTYLREHPKINPKQYLANLRTTIRIRGK